MDHQETKVIKGRVKYDVSEPREDKNGKMYVYFKLQGEDHQEYFCLCYSPDATNLSVGEELEVVGFIMPKRSESNNSLMALRVSSYKKTNGDEDLDFP